MWNGWTIFLLNVELFSVSLVMIVSSAQPHGQKLAKAHFVTNCYNHYSNILTAMMSMELFKHLDSNDEYGTLGGPTVPPLDVLVLDPAIAIKHKLVAQKTRLCSNGSQQVQGIDYEESYAPTVLPSLIRTVVAVVCNLAYLGLTI
jgi:hypothetical protein